MMGLWMMMMKMKSRHTWDVDSMIKKKGIVI